MALRSSRDVQKASYYVWFLGAEEAKGLRGPRVINPVLPYLIDRSRCHEPLKVTLQVSHKGIKIVQGSSKHLIPHSAITSSVQTDDIVACVLLLYNPATRCPLHVHAYRCDSESTAEALHMQLQVLINRPDNQKRFEELESRLGILPPLSSSPSSSSAGHGHNDKSIQSAPTPTTHGKLSSPTSSSVHNQTQYQQHHQHTHNESHRTHESLPKSFNSSLGSDTSSELFDSLAAELRAKLNGNGPPLLLPPRDYDTVHRSKGNLTAIELRRCRNALIVGGATPTNREHEAGVGAHTTITAAANVNCKQISSRGSSGIGSDLAPSPERQDLNSSSDDEHCLNETDNSVIGPKPSQIAMARAAQRSAPIISHQVRKSAVQPPEDSYLRDLPVKPYIPRQNEREREREPYVRALSDRSRPRDDNIVPVIIRPVDYEQNFNREMHTEKKHDYPLPVQRQTKPMDGPSLHSQPLDMDKCNEINQFLNKKLLRDKEHNNSPDQYQNHGYNNNKSSKHSNNEYDCPDDFDEPYNAGTGDQLPAIYRKENLPDKMKFKEGSSKKRQQQQQQKSKEPVAPPPLQRYGVNSRHRYVDPADLPFEQPGSASHNRFAAIHRSVDLHSPEQTDMSHRKAERHERSERSGVHERSERSGVHERSERSGAHERSERPGGHERSERHGGHERNERTTVADLAPPPIVPHRSLSLETERKHEPYSHSKERNPYREAESLPYIQSMEKMMKSSAMRYKSYDRLDDGQQQQQHDEQRTLNSSNTGTGSTRNQLSGHHQNEASPAPYHRTESSEYLRDSTRNVTQHDRFRDAKDKFRAMERPISRYDMADERDRGNDYKPRQQQQQHQPQQSRRHRQNLFVPTAIESSSRSDSGHLHSTKEQKHANMMLQQQSSLERRNHNCRSMSQDWSDDYDDDDDNDVDHSNEDVIGVDRHIPICMDSCKEPTSSRTGMNRSRTRSRDIWEESSGSGICQEPSSRRDLRDVRDMQDYTRYDVRPPSSLHSTSQCDVLPRESSRDRYCNEQTPQHQSYDRSVSRSRHRERDHSHEFITRGDYTPTIEAVRTKEKSSSSSASAAAMSSLSTQRVHYNERGMSNNGSPTPKSQRSGNSSQQHLANMPKGYRHSYAEPVFARSGGRVGLAAVNPY